MKETEPGVLSTRSFGVGVCVLLVFLMGYASGLSVSDKGVSVEWLNKWQTLIGAFVALSAAFIGAWFLNRQIGVAREIEREKRHRKRLAVRSVTPVALSSLSEYCMKCGERLHDLFGKMAAGSVTPGVVGTNFPTAPPEIIQTFIEFIEHCEPGEATAFRDTIASLQILSANLRDLQHPTGLKVTPSRLSVIAFLIRCADLYAKADMLYGYARFEHDDAARRPIREDIEKALLFFGLHREEEANALLFKVVREKYAARRPEQSQAASARQGKAP